MTKFKYISILIILVLVLILILQNTEPVGTHVLFWTFTTPRAVLLFVTTFAGFIAGVIAGVMIKRK